jgi:hypothetical protein
MPASLRASSRGEQDVRQLAVGIRTPAVPVALLAGVIEVEAGSGVRVGGDRDHPRGCGPGQFRQQQVGQQERRQMIDGEDVLEAVLGHPALA